MSEENINDNIDNEETNVNSEATNSAESGGDGDNAENAEVYSPDDALLERAVKAGMSLADAKSFGSKEMAERFIGMLEGKGGNAGGDASTDGNGDGIPAVDFGDFSEENGYDPGIVKAMNSLKGVIEAQAKVIKKLSAGKAADKQTKAVETRKNLVLARPGGERGRVKSGNDAESEILNSLRHKFKLN